MNDALMLLLNDRYLAGLPKSARAKSKFDISKWSAKERGKYSFGDLDFGMTAGMTAEEYLDSLDL